MMYFQESRPSDSESLTTETSDATSRATTLPDSSSDTVLPQQQGINRLNIQPEEEDRSSTPVTTTASVSTVISKKSNIQEPNSTQNQQQKPWVNPYWDANRKPNTAGTQTGNNNTNIEHSVPPTRVQQLIPGSIIINDRGEIDNTTRLNSNTSNNSFHPASKYISNDGRSPGGYLEPTHFQRRIVTSSPGLTAHPENHFGYKRSSSSSDATIHNRSPLKQQQTFPGSTDNNIQPWINPYWSKPKQTNSQFTQKDNANQNPILQSSNDSKQSSWTNPYWKDWKPQMSTTSQEEDQPWKNPYWKDWKPQISTTSQEEDQPWKNPYWKDWKPQISTTSQEDDQPWKNPYWKDWKPQISTTSQEEDQPWKNPYWKDWKPQISTTSQEEDQHWKNPYWKDWKPQNATTSSQQQDKTWQNPYWKDKQTSEQNTNGGALNKSLSLEYKDPPIPSFYKRIYPPYTPSSSPAPTAHIKHETILSSGSPKPTIDDNEDVPYTIDGQGIVHYRAASSSNSGTSKTVNFASSPEISQYPVSPPQPPSTVPALQTPNTTSSSSKTANTTSLSQTTSSAPSSFSNNIPSSLFSNLNNYPSSLLNYLSSTSSPTVLTETDLNNIQHALDLFATNSNTIPVIETPNQVSSSNINHQNKFSSALESLFTENRNQQSHQQPSSLSLPLASLFSSNREQQSQQQPPPSSLSSPLASLFSSNREQPSHQRPLPSSSSFSQHMQFNSPPYASNSNSQKSTLLSTPSYPSNTNEPSRRLNAKGPIALI